MYLEHFGLRERPFSSAPDPRFVYLGEHHERALAHLLRSVQARGSVAHLTGKSGIGKTTMCRMLLSRLPERIDVALILDPVPTRQELLSVVCDELGIAYGVDAASAILSDALYRKQAAGLGERRTVVIVDEAQSLSLDVIEQLYLLSSLELDGQKLLQVILIGEPWLIELLSRAAPHRPAQSNGYNLLPFTENETCAYVRHRMATAGGSREVFDVDALRDVHKLSSGVPRLINAICARALLIAVEQRRRRVDRSTVRAAARSALAPADSPAMETGKDALPIEPVAVSREPAPSSAPRGRRSPSLWLVSGGLALNALAIGVVFLAPRPPDIVGPPPETRAQLEAAATGPPPSAQTGPAVDEPARTSPAPDSQQEQQSDAVKSAPRPVAPQPVRPTPPAPTFAQEPSAVQDETLRQRRRRAGSELRAAASSPPPAARQGLPPQELQLNIDMLVWASKPQERMVYVNGHKYVEGETLENGAILEHIEQDGIVLLQAGQRLRLRSETR